MRLVFVSLASSVASLAVAACSGRTPAAGPGTSAPLTASSPVTRANPVLAPASFATVVGPWSRQLVGGAVTSAAGLTADDQGIALVVAGVDVEPTLRTRAHHDDAAWEIRTVASGRAIYGEMAGRTALVVTMDPARLTQDIVVLRGDRSDVVATGCERGASHLLSPDVLLYPCHGQLIVARHEAGRWTTNVGLAPRLVDGTVGSDETIYLFDADHAPPVEAWVIKDGAVTASTLGVDRVRSIGDVGFCGGRVYATFEQTAAHGGAPALGSWDGTAWQVETVTDGVAGSGLLALDEQCHAFVAIGDLVFSRGPSGWVTTALDEPGAYIQALAIHGDRIYAAYTVITDSSHAGLATGQVALSR